MRKRLFFLLALFLIGATQINAQESPVDTSDYIWSYAQLVGTSKLLSNKVNVEIDYGQESKMWTFQDDRIIDPATGKAKSFNSMVDAMNFMGALGWEFIQAYVVTVNNQNVYHWLLKIRVRKNEAGKFIPLTKYELLKANGKNE